MSTAEKAKTPKNYRFDGWQKTPIHQAVFGKTTRGGSQNTKFSLKHARGKVQSIATAWYLVDAASAPVGRVATTIATLLMGKHRTTFTPGAGSPDGVIVINADKAFFTSNKADKKTYYWHTQFMGGLKNRSAAQMLTEKPEKVIWLAVQGMLPKNKQSRYQLAKLKVYKGAEHPHSAQKPITVTVGLKKLPKAQEAVTQ